MFKPLAKVSVIAVAIRKHVEAITSPTVSNSFAIILKVRVHAFCAKVYASFAIWRIDGA
jgi:hypothetical protein